MGDLSDRMCEQDGITSRGNAHPVPQSDTPRTDRKVYESIRGPLGEGVVAAIFCRQLERELNEVRAELPQWKSVAGELIRLLGEHTPSYRDCVCHQGYTCVTCTDRAKITAVLNKFNALTK